MTRIKHLKQNKICRNFTYKEIAVLAPFVKEEEYRAGDVIFREGDNGNKLYILVDGQVGVRSQVLGNKEAFLAKIEKRDFFGELSLFEAGPRRVTAVALADNTILFVMAKQEFEELCQSEPFVSYKLIREMLNTFSLKLKESENELTELLALKKQ